MRLRHPIPPRPRPPRDPLLLLIRALLPQDGEVAGLLALMLLTEARRTARISASGKLVTLVEQDRAAWEVALATVDRLEDKLAGYHAYHATRADLLRRLGQSQQSRAAYDKAIELLQTRMTPAILKCRRQCTGSVPALEGG